MYFDEEGVVNLGEYVSLHHDSFDLILLLDILLLHGLDGVELAIVLPPNEYNFGVGALSDD